jgi:hypothetical protein
VQSITSTWPRGDVAIPPDGADQLQLVECRVAGTRTEAESLVHLLGRALQSPLPQDLTTDYDCQLILSEIVAATASLEMLGVPGREVTIRGREAPLAVRMVRTLEALATPVGV